MVSKVLMCPPKHFGVDYSINTWMDGKIGSVDHKLAIKQWETLYNALCKVVQVELIDPVEGLPDMVFTANAGLSVDSKVFLSKFAHNERSGEELYFKNWFLNNHFCVIEQATNDFEGEGDCLIDASNTHWMGYGFRSDINFVNTLWKFKVDTRAVELVDSRFYHIDTCFCPFPDGRVMYYPGAFTARGQDDIETHFHTISNLEPIIVSEEEAATFCCNAVVIGKDIFMPRCDSVAERLVNLGYSVQQFDMTEFQKSGGACKCLVMYL